MFKKITKLINRIKAQGNSSLYAYSLLHTPKKGFTLMEILISVSIFGIVIALSTTVYINITREQKRMNLQNAIYEDARLMMERIVAQARQHGVDYEEYYSQLIVQKDAEENDTALIYGTNYGKYASRFYDPGLTLKPGQASNPQDLGAECGDGTPVEADPDCITYLPSLDVNTGQNPYDPNLAEATAFCDGDCSGPIAKNLQKELYLISSNGTRKIAFAREVIALNSNDEPEYALSMVELIGEDEDNNGIVDTYKCDKVKGFNCPGIKNLPSSEDLVLDSNLASSEDFVPISSATTNVTDLKFIISPIEDPYKAFNEKNDASQIQPHITIMLTVEPTEAVKSQINFLKNPALTLQTTVTPRLYSEVKSFPPFKSMKDFKASF